MYSTTIADKVIANFQGCHAVVAPEKTILYPAVQVMVPSQKLREICLFVKSDAACKMDVPNHMTAIDYIKDESFELVYYLYSSFHKAGLVLKTRISRKDAAVDSVTDIWSGMDWQEREVFDLMGIQFKGHPNLKRIMMWEGFPGFPLRKDYVHQTDKYDSGLEIGTPGLDEKGIPLNYGKGAGHAG